MDETAGDVEVRVDRVVYWGATNHERRPRDDELEQHIARALATMPSATDSADRLRAHVTACIAQALEDALADVGEQR